MIVNIRLRKTFVLGEKPPKGMNWADVFMEIKRVLYSTQFIDEVLEHFDLEHGWPSGINNFREYFDPTYDEHKGNFKITAFVRDAKK